MNLSPAISAAIQIGLFFLILLALAVPLGRYIARVYMGEARLAARILGPIERGIYRVSGIDPSAEMTWKRYALACLAVNLVGILFVYVIQRLQGGLPFNPLNLAGVEAKVALNTAVSFGTNTNWQAYGGEWTMSYFTQMVALTVQNFLSAAVAVAVLVALVRGFTRAKSETIGNFWSDFVKSIVYVLLPMSTVFALVLAIGGVVQTFDTSATVALLDPTAVPHVSTQTIGVGPVASQIAIKMLGTNGGGFFNVNAAHPFENPTPFTNLLQVLAIILIPVALCFTFGRLVKDKRQGRALFMAMTVLFIPILVATTAAEQVGNPALTAAGADQHASELQAGGNMEGKEVRNGIIQSSLWATATTAASNGSVNAMHDSFTPLGGLGPMWLIQLGEVVYGGVGCGLYGMLVFGIVAVFLAGLMVGRTPEYLGKKIEAFEMKMASVAVLVPCAAILIGTALSMHTMENLPASAGGGGAVLNPGAHGFSEILYAWSSATGNNGSAFAGLTASGPHYAIGQALAMLIGRFWILIPVLALAGSLARKRQIPPSPGTMPTHGPLFVALLVGVVILVGALTFLPALALGPIVEHLGMGRT